MDSQLLMPRGSLLRIEDGRGIEIRVGVGAVWITQEGDWRDYYLGPGQTFRFDRRGAALVTAIRRTSIGTPRCCARRVLFTPTGAVRPVQIYPQSRADFLARLFARIGLAHAA